MLSSRVLTIALTLQPLEEIVPQVRTAPGVGPRPLVGPEQLCAGGLARLLTRPVGPGRPASAAIGVGRICHVADDVKERRQGTNDEGGRSVEVTV